MPNSERTPGLATARLPKDAYAERFTDLHPQLDDHEAQVAADRCYFCYDAPCMTACPTSIDIPLFIRQIVTGTPEAAAKTIFDQNILGGMCARVCPTETLCEEVCVREIAEGKPVKIGQLQRYATDTLMEKSAHPYQRGAATGKTVAVVGAGPAGLSAAHRLAMLGHDITLFDARKKLGGLNEFGIASYKSTDDFAQKEVDWLLSIGGITVEAGRALGDDLTLESLNSEFDAVFLSIGLGGVNALRADGTDLDGVEDAVDFIARLRQAQDLSTLSVGRDVVVIGGGMTAVDAAVQAKLLGAQNVTMAYRRGKDRMGASQYEQDLATSKGVNIVYNAQPIAILGEGACRGVSFEYTADIDGALKGTGEMVEFRADQVLVAIGQTLKDAPQGLTLQGGKIAVDVYGKTTVEKVWAGGDCASGGDDLTVTAVAEGRDAAMDIHSVLMGKG
ncbi:glutamate synthase (NADPH/NADH) small chain [Pacificibacter maritimus]|uniref:dihydrouracil dehydrogenase (NAD(+)) n=1 Tax=Pacificibacter maritimus TaxID=762213 RepID=A0A3N4UWD9_9RHOB|nr:NAD(P)-dependent oxidoreductase [Pacificibacter maritimus]RPE71839.1 glutamate synthase (NADPH/NADH) small chain [Pacificibacter maritimus]